VRSGRPVGGALIRLAAHSRDAAEQTDHERKAPHGDVV
jgi:hypothetical protein